MADCTLLVLTYKGKRHLEYLLPTIAETLQQTDPAYTIDVLVVDNGQDEATRQYVMENFPSVTYKFSPVNDYLFSLNPFVKELSSEYVFILNDDMRLHTGVLNKILPLMQKDTGLFALTCCIRDWDDTYTASAVRMGTYTRGWFNHYYLDPDETHLKYTLYPGGGAAIFRTAYFNELGGFDDLYRPAYSEDADLGIRAWQRGWKTIYHPAALLYHREGGTINDQFKKDKLEQMIYKNQVLWMIKNVRMKGFMFWFIVLFPYRLLVNAFKNKNVFRALVHAVPVFFKAYSRRLKQKLYVTDKVWLKFLNRDYLNISLTGITKTTNKNN